MIWGIFHSFLTQRGLISVSLSASCESHTGQHGQEPMLFSINPSHNGHDDGVKVNPFSANNWTFTDQSAQGQTAGFGLRPWAESVAPTPTSVSCLGKGLFRERVPADWINWVFTLKAWGVYLLIRRRLGFPARCRSSQVKQPSARFAILPQRTGSFVNRDEPGSSNPPKAFLGWFVHCLCAFAQAWSLHWVLSHSKSRSLWGEES